MAADRQMTHRLVGKYLKATRAEKAPSWTSCARSTAGAVIMPGRRLAAAVRRPSSAGEPQLVYSPEVVVEALRICWAVLDGPTGKRLAPALPMLVASLRRHGELTLDDATAGLLSGMSAATIDRRLAGDRAQLQTGRVGRGPSPGRCTAREIRLLNQLWQLESVLTHLSRMATPRDVV